MIALATHSAAISINRRFLRDLLFATNVLLANRHGYSPDGLRFLDEGRLVEATEGERGTYTVWKYSGSQFQIREGGIPKSVTSVDTEVHPNYSAELLQATVPLVLHEQPNHVLILGLGAGVPLKLCLALPRPQNYLCGIRPKPGAPGAQDCRSHARSDSVG